LLVWLVDRQALATKTKVAPSQFILLNNFSISSFPIFQGKINIERVSLHFSWLVDGEVLDGLFLYFSLYGAANGQSMQLLKREVIVNLLRLPGKDVPVKLTGQFGFAIAPRLQVDLDQKLVAPRSSRKSCAHRQYEAQIKCVLC
jgi:hypothetical protein